MKKNIRMLPVADSLMLTFRGRDVAVSRELKAFAHARLSSSLGRFSKRIQSITIWLEDINGPRGGVDKLCRLQAELLPRGQLVVSATAENEYMAVAQCARKARAAIDRTVKQRRTKKRAWIKASPRRMPLGETRGYASLQLAHANNGHEEAHLALGRVKSSLSWENSKVPFSSNAPKRLL